VVKRPRFSFVAGCKGHRSPSATQAQINFGQVALLLLLLHAMVTMAWSYAQAAEITFKGDTAYLEGDLDPEDMLTLFSALNANQVESISLDSRGGSVLMAVLLAKLIANQQLETRVDQGQSCASACAIILLAGKHRKVHSSARVGLHTAFFRDHELARALASAGIEITQESATKAIADFVAFAIAPDVNKTVLVALMKKADGAKGEIYWLNSAELEQL
jgi:hypothetical protein